MDTPQFIVVTTNDGVRNAVNVSNIFSFRAQTNSDRPTCRTEIFFINDPDPHTPMPVRETLDEVLAKIAALREPVSQIHAVTPTNGTAQYG